MKKLFTVLFLMLFAIAALTGCGTTDEDTTEDSNVVEEETTDVVAQAAMDYFANLPDSKHMAQPEDVVASVIAGEELFILDIRSAEDYAAGHLAGAYNVPYATVATVLEQLPNDTEILVYCYTGQTASQTTVLLNIAGKNASNVQKGFVNGISKVEGYEDAISTEEALLPEGSYPVDDEIEAAITDFYAEAVSNTYANFNMTVEQVKELVDAGSTDYAILSVRTAEDYALGHIAGAVNIPFGAGMQEQFATVLSTDKPVIVYCYTGQTASQTMTVLRMLGYEAYNMSQGMVNGWEAAGYEVVTE